MCSSAAYGVKEGIGEHSKKLPAEVELDRLANKWGVSTGDFTLITTCTLNSDGRQHACALDTVCLRTMYGLDHHASWAFNGDVWHYKSVWT